MGLRIAAGVAFLVTGILEVLFCGLSVVGTGLGGVMTMGSLIGELRHEEAFIGPVILIFYALWLVATAIAGPLHLVVGVWMLVRAPRRAVVWAATIASLLPVVTVYCAPTSLAAGVLGLVWLLKTPVDSSPNRAPASELPRT